MTSSVEARTTSSEPSTTKFQGISAPPVTRRTALSPVVARALRVPATGPSRERSVQFRVGLTWALLVLNVLTFYPHTWSGQPLILPIPSAIGKAITQGALPAALLMAVIVNRRCPSGRACSSA